MRVKDVIAILQSFNQEAELRIISDNRQEHGDTVKAIRQQGTHVYIHSYALQMQTLQTLIEQREQPTKEQGTTKGAEY